MIRLSKIRETLIEVVLRNFQPRSNTRKKLSKANSFSLASLLSKKEKEPESDEKKGGNLDETVEGEEEKKPKKTMACGGYGTPSKHYGISPVVKYLDYSKLFGHLGAFKTKGMYEDLVEETVKKTSSTIQESTREFVRTETIDKATRNFKYFIVGEFLTEIGSVPPSGLGIDSKEWEKYRIMSKMSIYAPLLAMKRVSV